MQNRRVGNPPREGKAGKGSGNQLANGFDVLWLMQGICKEDADELSDTGKEKIGLNGDGTVGLTEPRMKESLKMLMVLSTVTL